VRNKGSHSPSGSFADLTAKAVNRVRGFCEQCGCGVDRRKRFCLPCYDDRLMANIAANRHKYRKAKT
jgi:hypothetical protein